MSSPETTDGITPISRLHFEALCHSRTPNAAAISTEVEWWAGPEERVLGTVVFDVTDKDWFWILLGRDERSVFRCIDINVSIETLEHCREQLKVAIAKASATGQTIFPQMDQEAPRNDILIPVVPEEKLHPNFRILIEGEHHSSARELINEVAYAFIDIDGNYIKDFQTTGFNARLWELYLFIFLREQQFTFSRDFSSPDYLVQKWEFPLGIEAVTVNQTANKPAESPKTQEASSASFSSGGYAAIFPTIPLLAGSRRR